MGTRNRSTVLASCARLRSSPQVGCPQSSKVSQPRYNHKYYRYSNPPTSTGTNEPASKTADEALSWIKSVGFGAV